MATRSAVVHDDGYGEASDEEIRDDGYSESSDEQRRARQSAMMATTKQVTNKDERGVPRTTVATIHFIYSTTII